MTKTGTICIRDRNRLSRANSPISDCVFHPKSQPKIHHPSACVGCLPKTIINHQKKKNTPRTFPVYHQSFFQITPDRILLQHVGYYYIEERITSMENLQIYTETKLSSLVFDTSTVDAVEG